jgi:hypothetical protein
MSHRPTVSPRLADLIKALDAALRREFGQTGFSYHITAMDKTLAAANISKSAHLPHHRINPKTRKGGSNAHVEDAPPEALDL